MDDELNEEMANMIAKEGYMGGYESKNSEQKNGDVENEFVFEESDDELDQEDGDTDSIYTWLDEEDEDDYDEGTVVVIGRTHFFTGRNEKLCRNACYQRHGLQRSRVWNKCIWSRATTWCGAEKWMERR